MLNFVLDDPACSQLTDIDGGPGAKEASEPVADPQLCENLEVLCRLNVGIEVEQVVTLGQVAGGRRVRTVHLAQCISREQ